MKLGSADFGNVKKPQRARGPRRIDSRCITDEGFRFCEGGGPRNPTCRLALPAKPPSLGPKPSVLGVAA